MVRLPEWVAEIDKRAGHIDLESDGETLGRVRGRLRGKRRVIKSISARVHNEFNVSIAESVRIRIGGEKR